MVRRWQGTERRKLTTESPFSTGRRLALRPSLQRVSSWTTFCAVVLASACAGEPNAGAGDSAAIQPEPPPEAAPAAERGPYAVSARTLRFTDSRGKELVVEVWYPGDYAADEPPDPYPPTTLSGAAVRDQPADLRGAPYPVVGFSHGFAGIRFQSVYLVEHLASHGMVVVAPDHERNTFLDLDTDAVIEVLVERPGDVSEAVDALFRESEEGDWGPGLVQRGEWVAAGHSFGSYTTLVLGGGEIDYSGVERFCSRNSNLACSVADSRDPDEVQALVEAAPTVDDRVTGIVPMSPGLWYAFGAEGEGLAAAQPALFLAGDRDGVLGYREDARPTWEHHGGPALLATFHRAGHYAFSDICAIAPIFASECEGAEAGWAPIEESQAASATLVTAWVRDHWGLGVEGDAALLTPAAWEADERVTLED